MQTIELHAEEWKSLRDFYDALIRALGGPAWHGRNVNALIDSIVWGDINAINPPYTICIFGVAALSDDLREHIEHLQKAISEHRSEFRAQRGYDVEVGIEIMS